jgi:histidine decarboxylase
MKQLSWQYKLRNFTSVDIGVFENYFEDMPYDPYVKSNFRKRRFSSIKKDHYGQFEILPHKTFIQSADVNDLLGDVIREYEEISTDLIKSVDFQNIVEGFATLAGINPYLSEIGIHQMRILSSLYIKGEPAPEGRHQDGFDFIGIFCARRVEVSGGKSELFLNKEDQEPLLEKTLDENELLVVNDREVYHNATKLNPTGTDCGYRDVFVFTA